MDIGTTVIILSIIFFATLTRSTFGFGDALIAMPLLALVIELKIATPLMALIAFFIAITILIRNWKKVEYKSIWPLIISSVLGIPVGIWYLDDINENVIKLILGIIVLLFAIYSLTKPQTVKLKNEKFAWIFGFIAGVLGGAYNTNGPPIVIYSALKRWKPQNFRATLQGYFFMTGIFIVCSHALVGNFTQEVLLVFIYCLPIVLIAILLGKQLNKRIAIQRFHKYIYGMLAILGFMLIFSSLQNII